MSDWNTCRLLLSFSNRLLELGLSKLFARLGEGEGDLLYF
jgi:hypothetical protein